MLIQTRQFRHTFIVFTSLCALANGQDCLAQDEVLNGSGEDSARDYPRHRINLGALFLDQVSSDSFNGIVGYTYNLTHNANIGVTVPYIDPDTSAAGNSGIGDTIVALSFVPSVRIGANPWVPRTVGTGIAVLAPTGDPDERRSLDSWVVAPYLGLIIPLSEKFFFAPARLCAFAGQDRRRYRLAHCVRGDWVWVCRIQRFLGELLSELFVRCGK